MEGTNLIIYYRGLTEEVGINFSFLLKQSAELQGETERYKRKLIAVKKTYLVVAIKV